MSEKVLTSVFSSRVIGGVSELYGGRGHPDLVPILGFPGIQALKIPRCHPIAYFVKQDYAPDGTDMVKTDESTRLSRRTVHDSYVYVIRVLWFGLDIRDRSQCYLLL